MWLALAYKLHQEGLPAYWGIETFFRPLRDVSLNIRHQEGLPAYWGIETSIPNRLAMVSATDQEGLPAYWGIETCYDTGILLNLH